jgi:riboflavin biosynthesis pyrimidine reductase
MRTSCRNHRDRRQHHTDPIDAPAPHTSQVNLLLAPPDIIAGHPFGTHLDLAGLAAAYQVPPGADHWLRVNMVSTLDGAATGPDGVTGSINTPADTVVFDLLRALSDIVVIGAGTARAEGYGPLIVAPEYDALRSAAGRSPMLPLALLTRSGEIPHRLRDAPDGAVVVVTTASCPTLRELRADLGHDNVIVSGDDEVDLPGAVAALYGKGFRRIHSEGGPRLLGSLLAAGVVDELCLTLVPTIVGGIHPRIVETDDGDLRIGLTPHVLIHADGDLIGRWLVRR